MLCDVLFLRLCMSSLCKWFPWLALSPHTWTSKSWNQCYFILQFCSHPRPRRTSKECSSAVGLAQATGPANAKLHPASMKTAHDQAMELWKLGLTLCGQRKNRPCHWKKKKGDGFLQSSFVLFILDALFDSLFPRVLSMVTLRSLWVESSWKTKFGSSAGQAKLLPSII